jgi:hypothetical protein
VGERRFVSAARSGDDAAIRTKHAGLERRTGIALDAPWR